MLQPRAYGLTGTVAAEWQQQLLPCWLASLECITKLVHPAALQHVKPHTQQLQQNTPASRAPGALQLPFLQGCSQHTQQQMPLRLYLRASAATPQVQWSLYGPAQGSVEAAHRSSNPAHQAHQALACSQQQQQQQQQQQEQSYHAILQQVRGMHSGTAHVQGQQLQVGPAAVGSASASDISTGSDKDSGSADQQQQQLQQATSFDNMSLPDSVLAALKAQGFAAPTPVQVAAQQPILSGRNVALQSATGTGKTLAYLLPLLSRLEPWPLGKWPQHTAGRVLVLCPTQELCMQVLRAARAVMPDHRNKVQPLVGGANHSRQLMALKQHKPCMVVATPGRLLKVIHKGGAFRDAFPLAAPSGRGSGSSADHRMTLVFEEADKLLAMSDTVQVLRLLAAWLNNDRQQILRYAAAFKAAQGNTQHGSIAHVTVSVDSRKRDDAGSQDVQRLDQDKDFMQAVLGAYQVLLVAAGLKPSTLAGAPAWAATDPVMIAAPPPAPAAVANSAPKPTALSSNKSGRTRQGEGTDGGGTDMAGTASNSCCCWPLQCSVVSSCL
ncbi:P-loop containing nucleoside triphosphate hydrolase protein [Scenedesmus sp. NREL 46B-D3]|nr:P-loop containing nucleoside triphosphate hydrolase protein [Scenedesmus sp. NREL 46B-D3]